ncbi:MAG: hypothetical protein RI100_05255 [Nitrosarchaeum sp.]|uniref:hypothetical protein n=1 Tax=Nitrosarchaeum sp. TaxID=2026886 RepID=UPI002DF3CAFB|nr:hypothetical protein [Nitrosarchaeum sp.]
MVFVWIGIAIGIILVITLIIKISKINPQVVLGASLRCKQCGSETRGLKCVKCDKKFKSFGV